MSTISSFSFTGASAQEATKKKLLRHERLWLEWTVLNSEVGCFIHGPNVRMFCIWSTLITEKQVTFAKYQMVRENLITRTAVAILMNDDRSRHRVNTELSLDLKNDSVFWAWNEDIGNVFYWNIIRVIQKIFISLKLYFFSRKRISMSDLSWVTYQHSVNLMV